MSDRALFLTGPTAPLLCQGLLAMGGFIRLRSMPTLAFPALYGAMNATPSKQTSAYLRPSSKRISAQEWKIRGKIVESTRVSRRVSYCGPEETEETEETEGIFKAPDVWQARTDFTVSGSIRRVSVVLSVLATFPGLFTITDKEGSERMVIRCEGSPAEVHVALKKIGASLTEPKSA